MIIKQTQTNAKKKRTHLDALWFVLQDEKDKRGFALTDYVYVRARSIRRKL